MNKKTVIALCVVSVLVLVLGGLFCYVLIVPMFSIVTLPQRGAFGSPGVRLGEELMEKQVFASDPSLAVVTDIEYGTFLTEQPAVLAAVSTNGAVFFDRAGTAVHQVTFSSSGERVNMIPGVTGTRYNYMSRGSWTLPASLIGPDGQEVWRYTGPTGVDDMCTGDVDGDGDLDFIVGFNGGGGVHRVDEQGQKVWNKSGANVWHVEIADVSGDGTVRIVHSDAGGLMTIRDAAGEIERTASTETYFSDFSICSWPDRDSRSYCLVADDDRVLLLNFDGSTAKEFDAPGADQLASAHGVTAKLLSEEEPYFAVLVNDVFLFVYDPASKLVYHEAMPETCGAIAVLADETGETESILVGGTARVFQYRLKQ